MAANFTVIGSFTTIQVTGATTAVDVLRITATTIPSQVTFVYNAPYNNLVGVKPGDVQGVANLFLGPIATGIERMMGSGEVASALASEDISDAGLVIDYIDATVSYRPTGRNQPAPLTQVVRIPTGAFDEPSFYDALVGSHIDGAYQGLKALAQA